MITAEEYFQAVPDDRRSQILLLRKMIIDHPIGFKETMDYNLPSYVYDEKVIFAIANMKGHIGFYVCETDLKTEFKEVFKKYNCGKSCVRLKKVTEESLEDLNQVITQMIGS